IASPTPPPSTSIFLKRVIGTMSEFVSVATVGEIQPGSRKSVIVDDRAVLVIRVGDNYFAIEDICSHDGQPLTDGKLQEEQIECPRHGARFDLKSGRPMCMPATEPIATFAVKVDQNQILVGPEN
ncbi:MAG: non-heme iron oxygenase ferredoxin subunit, partial [Planctomycetales bacterium]